MVKGNIMSNDLMEIGNLVKLELKQSSVITPANYSFENALKSAWLILQETLDRNKKPALEVCSQESIQNAILNMALQGLNPAKNQCYFVVYGKQLQLIRSYMGAQMTAKLVNPDISDIRAQVVYAGDQIEIDVEHGRDVIKEHKRQFGSINKAEIVGAYAIAVGMDETRHLYTEIMTLDEIKASWKQSKMSAVAESGAINQSSTHGKFTGEMAKRTVLNRLCKRIINTSDDSALLSSFAVSEEKDESEIIQAHIAEHANRKLIDFPAPEPVEESLQVDPEGPAMATEQQIKELFSIEKENNRSDDVLTNVSGFIGREIKGLKELTKSEAAEFIDMQREEQKAAAGPDWQ